MREHSKNFETLLTKEAPPVVERMGLTWLVAAAIATALLWQVPAGDYILYPTFRTLTVTKGFLLNTASRMRVKEYFIVYVARLFTYPK